MEKLTQNLDKNKQQTHKIPKPWFQDILLYSKSCQNNQLAAVIV